MIFDPLDELWESLPEIDEGLTDTEVSISDYLEELRELIHKGLINNTIPINQKD